MVVQEEIPNKMADPSKPANAADGLLVRRFYAGASVFVTGGTGFMGKVLIEKLLWACPEVTAIYVLIREKRGETALQRVHTMLSSQCFDRLRESRGPGFGSKLIAVQGDITEERLGLSDLDRDLLADHVSVVFHVAATVRFNEPLHVAVMQNVRGTRELVALCGTFGKLKALVHVSTAFAHCPLPEIEERFYDAPMDCDVAIKMALAGELTTDTTETSQLPCVHSLLGAWPNTYTFTKALAEEVIRKHGGGLPVCVIRPAIVISSLNEPVAGWVDSMGGPGFVLAGFLTGYIRVIPCDPQKETALVPCDMVVDAILVSAWDRAQSGDNSHVPIYNFTPSSDNPISWEKYFFACIHHVQEMPSSYAIWTPGSLTSTNRTMISLARFILHTLPAGIADIALMLAGRKPFARNLFTKINVSLDSTEFFVSRQWRFQEMNVPALWDQLGDPDKAVFNFDMRSLDWEVYVAKTSPGIRKFILKEDPATIPKALIRYRRIKQAKRILETFIYVMTMLALFSGWIDVRKFIWTRLRRNTTLHG